MEPQKPSTTAYNANAEHLIEIYRLSLHECTNSMQEKHPELDAFRTFLSRYYIGLSK